MCGGTVSRVGDPSPYNPSANRFLSLQILRSFSPAHFHIVERVSLLLPRSYGRVSHLMTSSILLGGMGSPVVTHESFGAVFVLDDCTSVRNLVRTQVSAQHCVVTTYEPGRNFKGYVVVKVLHLCFACPSIRCTKEQDGIYDVAAAVLDLATMKARGRIL